MSALQVVGLVLFIIGVALLAMLWVSDRRRSRRYYYRADPMDTPKEWIPRAPQENADGGLGTIRPCYFCHTIAYLDVGYRDGAGRGETLFTVLCLGCGSTTIPRTSVALAVNDWNIRRDIRLEALHECPEQGN
jgi:hypothetical protein